MGRTDPRNLARIAVLAALAGLLAACGSSESTTGSSGSTTGAATSTSATAPSSTASAAAFVNIVEPFDPGHPARTRLALANCGSENTTVAIEGCYEIKTENIDVQIDVVQQAKYQSATPAQQTAILAQDSAWLAARQPVCDEAYHSGGTIDEINVASCLFDESTARLDALKGMTPPQVKLKATDSIDLSQLSWYTTPEGSRIAEINTQGDQSGGSVVAWVIIGGAEGFVVNPRQFYYQDGSFTDPGVVQPPDPSDHRVATGQQYQFSMDYSTLSHDPNANKSAGGFRYAPGYPAALWS